MKRLKKKKQAKHFDSGKPEISLIPYCAMVEMSKAFMYGQGKYGRFNFKSGLPYTKLIDSCTRHLMKFKEGENYDDESKTVTHIGHAMANLAMLMDVYTRMPEFDDRYKTQKKRSKKK